MKDLDQLLSDYAAYIAWLEAQDVDHPALVVARARYDAFSAERDARSSTVRARLVRCGVSVEYDMLWRSR